MKRVQETSPTIEKPIKKLVEKPTFSKELVKKAISNFEDKNNFGIALNTDVDMLTISKKGTVYIKESHKEDLKLVSPAGEIDVGFGRIGKFAIIGRKPDNNMLYIARVTNEGVEVQDLGKRAPKQVSRIDMVIANRKEFFNVGSFEAVIEAGDKF